MNRGSVTIVVLVILLVATLFALVSLRRRLRVLEAARRTEAKLSGVFRSNPDSITLSTLAEGRFLEVNAGFTELTGYDGEEALGHTISELGLWPEGEDRQRFQAAIFEHGEVRNFEARYRRRDDEIRWGVAFAKTVEIEGQRLVFSVFRDITERKVTSEALRVSEEKFATAFHASPDAVVLTAIPGGEILEANEGWVRICGWSREEVLGRSTLDLEIWFNLDEREHMFHQLRTTGRVSSMELAVRCKDGTLRQCQLAGETITLEGRPTLLSVVRDVTERQTMISELEAKNAELERFTYTVSHDLKSPLVTILGFLGLLERHAIAGNLEHFRQDAAHIKSAANHMRQLLDELLELSRVGHRLGPHEDVALGELAREAVDQLAGDIENRGVEIEIAGDLPVVVGDRLRLFEVFQNLIANAVKFFGDEAAPRIEVGSRENLLSENNKETVIFVRDNGIGIDRRYHEKIFGLFDRLDPNIPGTGVGLALVKRIIEVHSGRIWVESGGAGQGCTFCFSLGVAED